MRSTSRIALFGSLLITLGSGTQDLLGPASEQLILSEDAARSSTLEKENLTSANDDSTVSQQLYDSLEESSRITDIAYCIGPASTISTPFSCLSRCADFPAFELITVFSPSSPVPLVNEPATGYLAYDHNPRRPRLILAFRGTYSLADAIADLGTVSQPYSSFPQDEPDSNSSVQDTKASPLARCQNCTVHSGFYASYLATRALLLPALSIAHSQHPDYGLSISGHSLGGAVATLFALELHARDYRLDLTTFGAPRVGNIGFAKHIDSQLGTGELDNGFPRVKRVTHAGDPVPTLPWEDWGYAQPSAEIYISTTGLPRGPEDVHVCRTAHNETCSVKSSSVAASSASTLASASASAPAALGPAASLSSAKRVATDSPSGAHARRWSLWPGLEPWELVTAHRDYFHRLGLCMAMRRA